MNGIRQCRRPPTYWLGHCQPFMMSAVNTGQLDQGRGAGTTSHVPRPKPWKGIRLPLAVLSAATLIGSLHPSGVQTLPPATERVQAQAVAPAPPGAIGSSNEPASPAASVSTKATPAAFAPTNALAATPCQRTAAAGGSLPAVGAVSDVQLRNASAIVAAADKLALPIDARILGVQAALGESSLESKDYGDAAGPDSRGLFQQRANGAWASYSDRMDPFVSATSFFVALKDIKDWQLLPSSIAIHRVQRNQDPDHYTKYRQLAQEIVGLVDAQGITACSTGRGSWIATVGVSAGRQARPGPGTLISPLGKLHPSSPFGPRTNPVTGSAGEFHTGQDYAAACGTPVHSADEGTVREVGWHPWGGGNRVEIDHGNGLVTTYNHMQSVAVRKGEMVSASDVVGLVGSTGSSTGCHLHFETIMNGTLTDPSAWTLVPLTLETSVDALLLTSFTPQTGTTPAWNLPLWTFTTALGDQEAPAAEPPTLSTPPTPSVTATTEPTAEAVASPPPVPAATAPAAPTPTPTSPPTTEPTPAPTAPAAPTTEPTAEAVVSPEPTPTPTAPAAPTPTPTTAPTTDTAPPVVLPSTAPVVPTTEPTAEAVVSPEPTPTPTAPAPATTAPASSASMVAVP